MAVKEKVKFHLAEVDCFKELPLYNNHIEKPNVKRFKNIGLLSKLLFYEELNVIKNNYEFSGYAGYAVSYKDKLVEKKI